MRLARLRYEQGSGATAAAQLEGELRELGEAIGRVLGQITGLQTALDGVVRDGAPLMHLRLSLSALELGMVPFEAAIAPDNLPGSGAPLLLRTPTVITREVRRSEPIDVRWARKPRILFAFATPPGQRPVPAQEHLNALRRAIEPYVAIKDRPEERLPSVRQHLTVLPKASLKAIADACRDAEYTHVHVLAHGAPFEEAGHRRYGIALHRQGGGEGVDVVDGERLAIALRGAGLSGSLKEPPTLVSLATCDSGTVETILTPGGSIAHALHEAGIPWVVASQFPLWMSASTIAVECLYGGILSGADPRFVLHELRHRLRTEVPETHDWASIVAYAVLPENFDAQLQKFNDQQLHSRLNVRFARMDDLAARPQGCIENEAEFDALAVAIRIEHTKWIARTSANNSEQPAEYAEALGMRGASEKRIAIASFLRGQTEAARKAYEASREAYKQAVQAQPTNHWVITQFLSVAATPMLVPDDAVLASLRERYSKWWSAARQIAEWQLPATSGRDRAWALGTLAELELLASVYKGSSFRKREACERVKRLCQELLDSVCPGDFAVTSTLRQLTRYLTAWPHPRWEAIAKSGAKVLEENLS